jgi:hypothetical protein
VVVYERVGRTWGVVVALGVCIAVIDAQSLIVPLYVLASSRDSFVGICLRGERYESDIGDFIDGLAADLRDLLAATNRDEEDGSSDFENTCPWYVSIDVACKGN